MPERAQCRLGRCVQISAKKQANEYVEKTSEISALAMTGIDIDVLLDGETGTVGQGLGS